MAKKKVAKVVEKQLTPPVDSGRAEKCVICDREYTNRRMGEGSLYVGQPVCTDCLPKALAKEKAAKEAAEEEVTPEEE